MLYTSYMHALSIKLTKKKMDAISSARKIQR